MTKLNLSQDLKVILILENPKNVTDLINKLKGKKYNDKAEKKEFYKLNVHLK